MYALESRIEMLDYKTAQNEQDLRIMQSEIQTGFKELRDAVHEWPSELQEELKAQQDIRHKRTLQLVGAITAAVTAIGVALNSLIEQLLRQAA